MAVAVGAGDLAAHLPACQWGNSTRGALELLPVNPAERAAELRCAVTVASATNSMTPSGWSRMNYGMPTGFPLYGFTMSADSEAGGVLLFGGLSSGGNSVVSQTWLLVNDTWTILAPVHSPVTCIGSMMSDDPADGYVVYVGGLNETAAGQGCPSSGQTWVFYAGDWTRLHPTNSPRAVGMAAFANNSSGSLILYGGQNATTAGVVSNETWSFSAGAWTELYPTNNPGPRWGSGLTYDSTDHYLVLFGGGGFQGSGGRVYPYGWLNDTWSYQNGDWTDLNIAHSPPEPFMDGLTYDGAAGTVIYSNAYDTNYSGGGEDIWTYHAGVWTRLVGGGYSSNSSWPVQRVGEGAAYNWATTALVLYGGTDMSFVPLADTWTYVNGNWTNETPLSTITIPSARYFSAFAYDAADGYDVLFGGYGPAPTGSSLEMLNDTWKFQHGSWSLLVTNQSPPGRYGASMVYDASDGYVLLTGGSNLTTSFNDTWEFTNGGWSRVTPVTSPPLNGLAGGMTYDAADGYVVLVASPYYHSFTWAYHAGVWVNLSARGGAGPPSAFWNPPVYDSGDGYVLGVDQDYTTQSGGWGIHPDTWRFLNGNWTNLTSQVAGSPPSVDAALTVDYPAGGYSLLYGGMTPYGTYVNDTWIYNASSWRLAYSPQEVPARYGAVATYDPTQNSVLLFGGLSQDSAYSGCVRIQYNSFCNDLWSWSPLGFAQPSVQSFTISPSVTDVGVRVVLDATVVGGTSPYNYSYSGLPAGCLSANLSVISCLPTATGTYTVHLFVTDANGSVAQAAASLMLNPVLSVSSFGAAPSNLTVGTRTLLSVVTSGGTEPIEYSYSGLPPGCSSQTVPTLPCTPSAAGNYTVVVNASDAAGSWATQAAQLVVAPLGSLTGFRVVSFAVNPPAIVLGNGTTISFTTAGNTSTVNDSIAGLPPGCAGGTTTNSTFSLSCFPTHSGTYQLTLQANQSGGIDLTVPTNLTVYPAGGGGGLQIVEFAPSPARLVQGNSTVLTAGTLGGEGPLTFAYFGLPAGCASANTSALVCVPAANGTFVLEVTVRDSAGNRAGAFGHLAVEAGPGGHSKGPPLGGGSGGAVPFWETAWVLGVGGAILGAAVVWSIVGVWAERRRERTEGLRIVHILNRQDDAPASGAPPKRGRP